MANRDSENSVLTREQVLALDIATHTAVSYTHLDVYKRQVRDKAAARKNIDVYSKAEAGEVFLEISEGLKERVRLTADEISGLTAEEAAELKAKRQAAVRDTLDAEKKGTGELKLAKTCLLYTSRCV